MLKYIADYALVAKLGRGQLCMYLVLVCVVEGDVTQIAAYSPRRRYHCHHSLEHQDLTLKLLADAVLLIVIFSIVVIISHVCLVYSINHVTIVLPSNLLLHISAQPQSKHDVLPSGQCFHFECSECPPYNITIVVIKYIYSTFPNPKQHSPVV